MYTSKQISFICDEFEGKSLQNVHEPRKLYSWIFFLECTIKLGTIIVRHLQIKNTSLVKIGLRRTCFDNS